MKKFKLFGWLYYLLFIAFALSIISCGSGPSETVAVIDGEEITTDYFLYTEDNNFKNKSLEEKKDEVRTFYHTLLRARAAEDLGLADRPDLRYQIRANKRQALVEGTYQSYVVDSVVTESLIREAYDKMDQQREIRHIMIGHKDAVRSRSSRTPYAAESLATEVKQKITSGALDFSSAAQQYSDGPSASKGGSLGKITWGQMDDAFQEAAWNLPLNTVSDPVRTPYGFHLVEVTGIDTVDLGPYAEERSRIRSDMMRNKQREISRRGQDALQEITNTVGLTVHDSVMNRVAGDLVEAMKQSPAADQGAMDWDSLLNAIEYQPVADLNGSPVDREQFTTIMNTMQANEFYGASNTKAFVRRLQFELQQEAIMEFAGQHQLQEYGNVSHRLRWEKARILGEAYLKDHVLRNFPPSDDSLRAFYQRHKADRYARPPEVHIREIYFTDKETAEKVGEMLRDGGNFADLAAQYSRRAESRENRGDLGWFSSDRYGPIGQRAKEMTPGDIAGPFPVGTGWSVIKLEGKKGGGAKPFDEIKTLVKNNYNSEVKSRVIRNNIDSLETAYDAEVRYRALESL